MKHYSSGPYAGLLGLAVGGDQLQHVGQGHDADGVVAAVHNVDAAKVRFDTVTPCVLSDACIAGGHSAAAPVDLGLDQFLHGRLSRLVRTA